MSGFAVNCLRQTWTLYNQCSSVAITEPRNISTTYALCEHNFVPFELTHKTVSYLQPYLFEPKIYNLEKFPSS